METAQYTAPGFDVRRYQNFVILGLLYAFFYMTRYNVAASMPQIMNYFGWDKPQLGFFETALPIFYGLSVIVNGPLADRIGGKKAFLRGAVGVVLMNVLMGASTLFVDKSAVTNGLKGEALRVLEPAVFSHGFSSGTMLAFMVVVWSINGYFQSFGALAIVKVNTAWFHKLERGQFAAVFGILIRLGLIFAFSGVPIVAKSLPLCWVWWIPACCVAVMAVLVWRFVENSPREAGYPDFTTGEVEDPTDERPATIAEIMRRIFANRTTWFVVIASVMIGFVRRGTIDSWTSSYFMEVHGADGASFAYQLAAWGIGILGIAGGFVLGLSSDKLFGGRRAPAIFIGFLGMAFVLVLSNMADRYQMGPVVSAILLACLSLFVNGAHGLIGGAASMDVGGKKASATAAGLFDGAQYLIAAPFTGIGMGWLLKSADYGWSYWQLAPLPFAIIGAIAMLMIWNVVPGKKAH